MSNVGLSCSVLYIGLGMTVYILYMQSVYFCFYAREKWGGGRKLPSDLLHVNICLGKS